MDEFRTPSAGEDAPSRQYRAQQRVEVQREAELAAAHAPEAPIVQPAEKKQPDAQRDTDTSESLGRTRNQVEGEMDDALQPRTDPASQYTGTDQQWGDARTEQGTAHGSTDDPYSLAGPMPTSAFAAGKAAAQVPLRAAFQRRATSMYFRANERLARQQAAARGISQPPYMHPVFPSDPHMEAERRSNEVGEPLGRAVDAHPTDAPYMSMQGESSEVRRHAAQRGTGDDPRMPTQRAPMEDQYRPSASSLPPLFFDTAVVEPQAVESRRTSEPVKHTPMPNVRWLRSEEHPAVSFEFGRTEVPPRPGVVNSRGVQPDTPLETPRDATCAMPHQRNNEGSMESATISASEERPESLHPEHEEEETARERPDASVIAGAGHEPIYERQRTFDGTDSGDTAEDNGRRFIEQRMRIVARRRAEQREQTTEVERRASADRRSSTPAEDLQAASSHADGEGTLDDSIQSEQAPAQGGHDESTHLHSLESHDQPADQAHSHDSLESSSRPLFLDDPVHEDLVFTLQTNEGAALAIEDETVVEPDMLKNVDGPDTGDAPPDVAALPEQTPEVTSFGSPEPQNAPEATSGQHPAATPQQDTPQQLQDGVADHWFARKGLRNFGPQLHAATPRPASYTAATPCMAVVALSGGVGKTSLVATVGRVLSSLGESVLLADTTSFSLLPYYFGAREQRLNVVRTFNPPQGSTDAPVYLVNYDTDRLHGDQSGQVALTDELMRHGRDKGRILLDVNGSSAWMATLLTHYQANILVPIAPDMNAVFSIDYVDRFFSNSYTGEGNTAAPHYVLNQFDASQPLHMEVREVLRKQLGDRLLPMTIRRSPAVAEALAEGMTVIDYAPESPVTDDYRQLAEWVRTRSAPAIAVQRSSIRWSER